jgi:hypothetical protein
LNEMGAPAVHKYAMVIGMTLSGVYEMSKTSRRLRRMMPKSDPGWLACDDPLLMLEVLRSYGNDRPGGTGVTAGHVLRLWQQNPKDFRAADYLQAVWERARDAEEKGNVIG